MNRVFLAVLFAAGLALILIGCTTAASPSYYSSKNAVLGKRTDTNNPPATVDQRLSGSQPAPAKPATPQ
ncbi:MAG TPA: hypothetical protein VLZ30_08000 [Verrucomicrobiae bacterium]|nr:hypothetical protein [Verrucomicrobiae bacterium]